MKSALGIVSRPGRDDDDDDDDLGMSFVLPFLLVFFSRYFGFQDSGERSLNVFFARSFLLLWLKFVALIACCACCC